MKTSRSFRLVVSALSLVGLLQLGAQPVTEASSRSASTGAISGRISNQGTRLFLEGAHLALNPGGLTTLTGRDGQFEFTDVPAGSYTLTASYAGLETETTSVEVAPGGRTTRDFELTSGVYVLDAVVVPGEREGNAQAVQLQRYAPNVKNVLSSDAFGNVADENIGNFLLRIPGVTGDIQEGQVTFIKIRGVNADLNSVTIDGTRASAGGTRGGLDRGFEIDTVPADLVDTIEITKAPTPDMDADSVGGSVNLKTKSALNRRGSLGSYKAGYSYNVNRKSFRPQGSFMYSDTLGANDQWGVMVTSSFSWASNPRDVIFGAWEPTLETNRPAYYTLSSAGEDYFEHKRGGTALRVDYRLSPQSTLYVNLMYSGNHDRLFRRRNGFAGFNGQVVARYDANGLPRTENNQPATLLPGWTDLVTEAVNITHQRAQVDRRRKVRTYNFHAGGEHRLGAASLDYNVNFSPSEGREWRTNITTTVPGVSMRFERIPQLSEPGGGRFIQTGGPDVTQAANIVFNNVGFNDDTKKNRLFGGQLNFRMPIDAGVPTYVKTGLRFRIEEPEQTFHRPAYNYTGPRGAALERYLDQSYTYQPRALRGTMPSVRFIHIPTVLYDMENQPELYPLNRVSTLRNQLTSDRNASEAVYAAYAMGGARLGRLGILAGLRVEETHVEGTGNFQFISPEERARRSAWTGPVTEEENLRRTEAEYGNRRTNTAEYRNVFPGVHFRYEFTEAFQGRLSYSTGIGRPSFNTIIPNDSVSDTAQRVTINNTSLKPQYADNFDLTFEYYFRPAGLVSAGVFLKEIDNFIFATDRGLIPAGPDNGFNGDYVGYTLNTQANGGSARIRGLELSYQQQFTNLPGFWRGFGVYANHTWLETKGDYGTPGAAYGAGEVPGFVPQSGNVGISYGDHRWKIRGQMNFQGDALAGSLNPNPAQRQYNYSKKRVDFNVSYRFSRALTLYADVINALGDPLVAPYIYIPARKRGADRFSTEIKAGITGQF